MASTPNMNLEKPIIGEDTWPESIEKRNRNDDKLDSHNHATGKGVQIPTSGINIDQDLSVNQKSILNLKALNLAVSSHSEAPNSSFYRIGDIIYYKNSNGVSLNILNFVAGATTHTTVAQIEVLSNNTDLNTLIDQTELKIYFGKGGQSYTNLPEGLDVTKDFLVYVLPDNSHYVVSLIGGDYFKREYVDNAFGAYSKVSSGIKPGGTTQEEEDILNEFSPIKSQVNQEITDKEFDLNFIPAATSIDNNKLYAWDNSNGGALKVFSLSDKTLTQTIERNRFVDLNIDTIRTIAVYDGNIYFGGHDNAGRVDKVALYSLSSLRQIREVSLFSGTANKLAVVNNRLYVSEDLTSGSNDVRIVSYALDLSTVGNIKTQLSENLTDFFEYNNRLIHRETRGSNLVQSDFILTESSERNLATIDDVTNAVDGSLSVNRDILYYLVIQNVRARVKAYSLVASSVISKIKASDKVEVDYNSLRNKPSSDFNTDGTLEGNGSEENPLQVANPFTPEEKDKLQGIEDDATADQSAREIRDSLQTLSGENRLDASAIKNLSNSGGGNEETFSPVQIELESSGTTSGINVPEGATNLYLEAKWVSSSSKSFNISIPVVAFPANGASKSFYMDTFNPANADSDTDNNRVIQVNISRASNGSLTLSHRGGSGLSLAYWTGGIKGDRGESGGLSAEQVDERIEDSTVLKTFLEPNLPQRRSFSASINPDADPPVNSVNNTLEIPISLSDWKFGKLKTQIAFNTISQRGFGSQITKLELADNANNSLKVIANNLGFSNAVLNLITNITEAEATAIQSASGLKLRASITSRGLQFSGEMVLYRFELDHKGIIHDEIEKIASDLDNVVKNDLQREIDTNERGIQANQQRIEDVNRRIPEVPDPYVLPETLKQFANDLHETTNPEKSDHIDSRVAIANTGLGLVDIPTEDDTTEFKKDNAYGADGQALGSTVQMGEITDGKVPTSVNDHTVDATIQIRYTLNFTNAFFAGGEVEYKNVVGTSRQLTIKILKSKARSNELDSVFVNRKKFDLPAPVSDGTQWRYAVNIDEFTLAQIRAAKFDFIFNDDSSLEGVEAPADSKIQDNFLYGAKFGGRKIDFVNPRIYTAKVKVKNAYNGIRFFAHGNKDVFLWDFGNRSLVANQPAVAAQAGQGNVNKTIILKNQSGHANLNFSVSGIAGRSMPLTDIPDNASNINIRLNFFADENGNPDTVEDISFALTGKNATINDTVANLTVTRADGTTFEQPITYSVRNGTIYISLHPVDNYQQGGDFIIEHIWANITATFDVPAQGTPAQNATKFPLQVVNGGNYQFPLNQEVRFTFMIYKVGNTNDMAILPIVAGLECYPLIIKNGFPIDTDFFFDAPDHIGIKEVGIFQWKPIAGNIKLPGYNELRDLNRSREAGLGLVSVRFSTADKFRLSKALISPNWVKVENEAAWMALGDDRDPETTYYWE